MKTTKKLDRRTDRTRAALMTALVDILLSEGYSAVTVERIAERANVGRSTFYMHYNGKDDILKASLTRPSSRLAALVGGDIAAQSLVPLLLHFHENRKRNRVFFGWETRDIWVRCLSGLIASNLATTVHKHRDRPLIPVPMIARQIAEAQIALVSNWLLANTATKPDTIAEALDAITQALLSSLLRGKPSGRSIGVQRSV